tara:strand:- start:1 stop:207 length:207 start_codon:yes stop_codon:yes gene_type:complete
VQTIFVFKDKKAIVGDRDAFHRFKRNRYRFSYFLPMREGLNGTKVNKFQFEARVYKYKKNNRTQCYLY